MSATWGNNFKLTIFGESHGAGLGVILDGLPAGLKLDQEFIKDELKRRAPGLQEWSTPRKEGDNAVVQSGVYQDKVTGAPLLAIIYNENQHSEAYKELVGKARPGHADWTSFVRYGGFNDPRGSGHFSGRLTASLVFAGAVAKQYLSLIGIECGAWITSIGKVSDNIKYPDKISSAWLKSLKKSNFPVRDENLLKPMQQEILDAKDELDSVGGKVSICALGVPVGWGDPFFESVESVLASLLFSVPAVKGVEFGKGFDISSLKGSQANDEWFLSDGKMTTKTNNNGGINGGISNGMPILANVAIKPASSISKTQKTVNFIENKEIDLSVGGRHDPCIVPRAVVVLESVMAIALLDIAIGYLGRNEVSKWIK